MEKVEQWSKIRELFAAALDLHPSERESYLRSVCSEDDLRAEVESLLAAYEGSSLLSRSPWFDSVLEKVEVPKTVGPYRLVTKLGEGGMGQVWLAEQTEPVRRQVALKLVRAGMYDEALLQRFQSERQSLAMMDHPAIAKVFEAGAAANGQPYLVMEYVPGLPITDYSDQKRLGIADRLKLFIAACEGVQHAHQKAIIHRDLKPANILVVEVDGKPAPRIIDFGLAKTMMPALNEKTLLLTQAGSFLGTPGYMSPEQAQGDAQNVDTRSDVYSLGVILYVLLTGFLPREVKKQTVEEFLRRLREEDPPPPSARVAMENEGNVATQRSAEPRQLAKLLRGDLDRIVMKALEKDRARRYGTASELAADIDHYLNHEPVIAAPASTAYRFRKYFRRNWVGVSVAAGLVLVLSGFATMQSVQLRRITRERDRADRITQFMTGMFRISDPNKEARSNSITAREILDKASADIGSGLSQDPELQSQMMLVMGRVYGNLGLYSRAQSLLARSVDIRRRAFGPKDPITLRAMDSLAQVLQYEGQYVEAEKIQREILAVRRNVLGREHPETLWSMLVLAWTLNKEGYYDQAEKLEREALDIHRRLLGPENYYTLADMQALASTLHRAGHADEGEKLQREALEIQRRVLGPHHPATLTSMNNLANTLVTQGRYAEAEQLQREALEIQRRVLGPEHPDTLRSMLNLGWSLNRERRYSEAETLGRETLEKQQHVLGREHPETLMSMSNLADTLVQETRCTEAEKLQTEVVDTQRRTHGPAHSATAEAIYDLAGMEARAGKHSDAVRLLRQAVDHGLSPATDLAIDKDPNLRSLYSNPSFQDLVAHAKEQASLSQKAK